ncbi:hypothetical protein KR026_010833, partial [Drosophila bipectinata]
VEQIPQNYLVIVCSIMLSFVWLGSISFMASRVQRAVNILQRQLDELWLLQARPTVWPHAPFIPNPNGNNPPEYIAPVDPEEREILEREERDRIRKAKAYLEANKNKK